MKQFSKTWRYMSWLFKKQGGGCLAGKGEGTAGAKAQRHETAHVQAATRESESRWGRGGR